MKMFLVCFKVLNKWFHMRLCSRTGIPSSFFVSLLFSKLDWNRVVGFMTIFALFPKKRFTFVIRNNHFCKENFRIRIKKFRRSILRFQFWCYFFDSSVRSRVWLFRYSFSAKKLTQCMKQNRRFHISGFMFELPLWTKSFFFRWIFKWRFHSTFGRFATPAFFK